MKITIKEIAREAGVSIATVSNYLNGKGVKKETGKRIEEAISKFQYVPNPLARSMRAQKKNLICVFLPKVGDYFWGNLYDSIEQYFRRNGYTTIILSRGISSRLTKEAEYMIKSEQIAGGIIIAERSDMKTLPLLLEKEKIPYVCVDQPLYDYHTDIVSSNNVESAYKATKYLIEKGHRKLAILGRGYDFLITMQERLSGFLKACEDMDIDKRDIHILSEERESILLDTLSGANPPTAILSSGYDITVRAIMKLQGRYRIPEDISLVSFDDDEMFEAISPPITIIEQDIAGIGERAAEILLKRIHGDMSDYPAKCELPTCFVERGSVREIV